MPGWLEDGRQGARALHVTHGRMARLPKVSRLLMGAAGRGLDGTAGIRPRHGGVARRRLGRRPFRRIHPPTRPCLRRSNGHAGQTDMSHARERGGHRGGRGACGPGRAAGTARDRRQVRRAPRPLFAPCPPVLVVLPYLPSIPLLPPRPPLPSRPRLSPLSAACLLPSRIAIRALGDGGAHRHAPHCPLLPASVCSPLGVAVRAVRLPLCPPAFPLRQRSRGLGLGWLLTSPRRTDARDARAPGGGAFEVAQHGVRGRRGTTDKAEWAPAGLCLGAF